MWTDSWRGARQADTEDGRTTSPPVPPCPLSTEPGKTPPVLSSSSPGRPQNLALDRSKSAPASLPQLPPQGSNTSGSCQTQSPFQGLPAPTPPALATLETSETKVLSQAPLPKPVPSPSPTHPPNPASLDMSMSTAEDSSSTSSLNTDDAEIHASTAMDVGVVSGREGKESVTLSSLPHPCPSIPPTEQKPEDVQSTDAKNMQAIISGDVVGEKEWRGRMEMESVCGEFPSTHPLDAKLDPDLSFDGENLASEPACGPPYPAVMDSPIEAQAVPQSERDQPEGERQPNCDNIPSLAAALLELHELLVSNSRILSQERSPSPSCREDADGVDYGPGTRSQPPALTTATAKMAAPEPENASVVPLSLPTVSASSCPSGLESSPETGEPEAGEEERDAPYLMASRESKMDGELVQGMGRGFGSESEVTSLPHEGLEFREPPEGQQGRGVADGQAAGPDAPDPQPAPMEVTSQNTPPTATSSLCCTPAMPEEDSGISLNVPHPLPLASHPTVIPPPSPTFSSSPLPHPPMERFPAAHIRQIQAAGFSAVEAAEALEQVQGHVELALLMLLARKITVPS
ncbi:hypothetical protein AGOR_G00157370 [Albula goreensis]|uniref:UBA domain-containing protein n=1 Tax=Albula goreensis TaxID=1534307 RepID=A0A8T3CZM1_9TELE|nr:hypothetical protein AGOR_G00157370 [Albula goreensis]